MPFHAFKCVRLLLTALVCCMQSHNSQTVYISIAHINTFLNSLPQDRSRMYDSLNMHSLESSLIDIMRAEQDPLKGKIHFLLIMRVSYKAFEDRLHVH